MHPVLSGGANLGAYFLGWLFVAFACAGLTFAGNGKLIYSLAFGAISALLASLLFFPVYYPCLALKPGKTGTAILLSSLAVAAAAFGVIWAGAMFLALYLLRQTGYESFQMPNFVTLVLMGSVLCVLTEAVYYIYIAHTRTREAERLEQELRVMAREAELRALRAQLNPHFLFNSLNSINALTGADPKRAREMCVLLSDFLRKGLRLGERLSVPLSEELDLLKNYFTIEQIRFGSRLEVDWEIDDTALNAEVPTLLLQPLVENAIKHGISQLIEGGTVRIKAGVKGVNVLILLENPVDSDVKHPKGLGLGIKQVRQRLAASFGADGHMEVDSKNGLHSVRLFFPFIKKEASDD
ncbi:MAG: histidine kinase [Holophagales bacterium]|jgi:sensor histidine kinase YesM|nr:histidine kinase [Holophagales bacterium]